MGFLYTWIGIILAIGGGIIQSFGFILQKMGHNQIDQENENNQSFTNQEKEKDKGMSGLLTNKIWWLGMSIYTLGGLTNCVALNFAAQSIISPLSAINLATNTVLSYFILKEAMTKMEVLGIVIIIIGCVVTVIFGPTSGDNIDVNIDTLRVLFEQVAYIACVSTLTGMVVLNYFGVFYFERKNKKDIENDEIVHGKQYLMFSYTEISSYFAANNTLFIKALVTVIGASFISKADLRENGTDYLTYLLLVLWVICILSMEYFRQKALSHFGALYVVPIFSVSSIVLTTVIGGIYFQEFQGMTVLNGSLFGVGIFVTVIGVVILSMDIGKYLEEFDDLIRVAFIDKEQVSYNCPKRVVYGGYLAEGYLQYFFNNPPVCYSKDRDYPDAQEHTPLLTEV